MNDSEKIQSLALAEHYFRSNNYQFAEHILNNIIKFDSYNSKANELLAYIYGNRGDLDACTHFLKKSCEKDDCSPEALYYLSSIQLKKNQPQNAKLSLMQAIEKAGEFFEALHDLGTAHAHLGEIENALFCYQKCLKFNKNSYELYFNIARCLEDLMRFDEALSHYDHAIQLNPNYAEAWSNKGITLSELKRYDEALSHYDRAIQLNPDYAEAWSNKGITLSELKRYDEALSHYDRAIQLNPDYAEAWSNKGITLSELKRYDEALSHYDRAIQLNPDYAEAWSNKGFTLHLLKKYDDALTHHEKAVTLKPEFVEGWSNSGLALTSMSQIQLANQKYDKAIQINPNYTIAYNNKLLNLNYFETICPEVILDEAKSFGDRLSKNSIPKFKHEQSHFSNQKIKVGFVSGDFRSHSVGFFLEGLISHLDQTKFELYAFPTCNMVDDLTKKIAPFFKEWIPIYQLSDFNAATVINRKQIHILIDLAGHTAKNRLPVFSYKPAPIQVSWLGYPSTTGLPEIDYVLGDQYALPIKYENQFTERIWRISQSYLCLTPPELTINKENSPCSKNRFITFGSFNNLSKINLNVIRTWSNILQSVPDSKLLIKTKELECDYVREDCLTKFRKNGVESHKLILMGETDSREKHLNEYNKIDIALDTFPYPGVTTSCEAIWMGVPVISLKGNTFLSSTATTIAINAGINDCVASDTEQYAYKAINLAFDFKRLSNLRSSIKEKIIEAPLFNASLFAKNFGNALEEIFQQTNLKFKASKNLL